MNKICSGNDTCRMHFCTGRLADKSCMNIHSASASALHTEGGGGGDVHKLSTKHLRLGRHVSLRNQLFWSCFLDDMERGIG
jgi:hypothetical protein